MLHVAGEDAVNWLESTTAPSRDEMKVNTALVDTRQTVENY